MFLIKEDFQILPKYFIIVIAHLIHLMLILHFKLFTLLYSYK
jgi:hypothetical protein